MLPVCHHDNMSVSYTPLHPHCYSKTGVYRGILYFLIFALKHRSWVLTEAVLMCTHNLYFEQKIEKYHNFSSENYHFYSHKILQFSTWACSRNVVLDFYKTSTCIVYCGNLCAFYKIIYKISIYQSMKRLIKKLRT